MNIKIYKSNNIELGDLVDFDGNGDYGLVIAQYDCTNGLSYGLLNLDTNKVSTKFYYTLDLLIQDLEITLVAKKNELSLICGEK